MLPTKKDYEDIRGVFPTSSTVEIYGHRLDKDWPILALCIICKHDREISASIRWGVGVNYMICTMCFPRLKPVFDQLGWPNMRNGPHLWAKYYLASMPNVEVRSSTFPMKCDLCDKRDPLSCIVELKWRFVICTACHIFMDDAFNQTVASEKRIWTDKLWCIARSIKGRDLHRDIFRIICALWANMTDFGRIAAAKWPVSR